VDVEITSHTLVVRGRAAVLVVVHHVTDRKRAELALRQSEAQKAAILESALDCIVTMDGEGLVVGLYPSRSGRQAARGAGRITHQEKYAFDTYC
jgi:PAS domain-containing protein